MRILKRIVQGIFLINAIAAMTLGIYIGVPPILCIIGGFSSAVVVAILQVEPEL